MHGLGSVFRQPHQLVYTEDHVQRQAGNLEQRIVATQISPVVFLRLGAVVVPGDDRVQRLTVFVEQHTGLTHAGGGDGGDLVLVTELFNDITN